MGTVANMEIKKGINKPNVHCFALNEISIFGNIFFTKYPQIKYSIEILNSFVQNYHFEKSNLPLKMFNFM